jgi:CheY-like chemotaxis protein
MQHFSIPTCYFPSTTLFIDGNRDFLLNFVLQLDEWLAYRVYDSPFDALESIQKSYRSNDILSQHCLRQFTKTAASFLNPQSNLAALCAQIYNPKRFGEVSVVVVDYAMPGMVGLDFCRRINNTAIKKILLTGKADEKIATDAFNQGLIHRYIHKSDPDVAELITRCIYELQWQYFKDTFRTIGRLLSIKSPACLHDKKFSDFFQKTREEKKIVEFYLADNNGSFLLLDVDAQVSFLLVQNEGEPCKLVQESDLLDIDREKLVSYHSHLQEIDIEELLLL